MKASAESGPFFLRAVLIATIVFWIYEPALAGSWVMDDVFYLPQNVLLHDPHRLWKIWLAPGDLVEYYPIEATVQAVQWHLWHLNTVGYHLTNVVLHILSALLLWRLLEKFNLRFAWLGGLLFAVHPMAVESVAWISELKNTLSLPPFLLAMICWTEYEEKGRPRDYGLALGLFIFAMLCKVSMALFPLVLLLYAWWKRDRIGWRDLTTTAPFFAISLVLGLTTVLAGDWFRVAHLQLAVNPEIGNGPERFVLSGTCLLFYFTQYVCPINLIPIYPKWPINPASPLAGAWLIMIGALFWFWVKRGTWGRHALLGVGFFLINLLPFIGLNSVTYMGFTWVMDHLVYLPMIGLVGLSVAALETLRGHFPLSGRRTLMVLVVIGLALLAARSHLYAGVFAGPGRMWTYTLERNPTSWIAHNNLANDLMETGHVPEAIAEYEEALYYHPAMVEAHSNLGLALDTAGRAEDARKQYELALKYNPHFGLAHANLGRLLLSHGHVAEARAHFEEALRINPQDEATRDCLRKMKNSE